MNWTTEKRAISQLKAHPKNPRILTEKQHEQLTQSLKSFNLAEIPVINKDNTILAGHQRIRIMKELHGEDFVIEVRVPDRQLTDNEADEYLIRSNKNTGEWNFEELANNFENEDLTDWGFTLLDLGMPPDKEDITDEQKEPKTLKECPECGHQW